MSEQESSTTSRSLRLEIVWLLVGIVFTPLYFYVAVLGWYHLAVWYPGVLGNVIIPVIVILALLALIRFIRDCFLLAFTIRYRARHADDSWNVWIVLQLIFMLMFFISLFPAMFAIDEVHPRVSQILNVIYSRYVAIGILLLQIFYIIWLAYRGFMDGVRRGLQAKTGNPDLRN